MNDKDNKKVPDKNKSKEVAKKQRKISDMTDNCISKSLKSYMEMNKVAAQIPKPYFATNNLVPKLKAFPALENFKTNRLSTVLTVNNAWNNTWQKQKYLKQTGFTSNKFNSAIVANNNSWQQYFKEVESNANKFRPAVSNTVWQEYLKRSENTANIFRNAVKPFKVNNAFTKNYSQIAKVSDRFQKLVERTLGNHSENLNVAILLMKNGWVTSEFFYNSVLKDNYDKLEKDILEYVEKFYTENNYQRFFRVFDLVIEGFKEQGLNEGYRLSLVKIRKLLKQDFDNYDLFMNITFSIIDYLCSFKFGILSTNDYIREKSIGTARRKYADNNGQLTKIDIMSMFGVLKSWWKKINFKKGLDRTDFGRSPIEHGRYDPRRYKRTDFVKLILLMFNVLMAPDPDIES